MEDDPQPHVVSLSPESVVDAHHHKQHFQGEMLSSGECRLYAWRFLRIIRHEDWPHATDVVLQKGTLLLTSSEESMTELL